MIAFKIINKHSLLFSLISLILLIKATENLNPLKKTARVQPTCLSRMFTIEMGNIAVEFQTIRVSFRLDLIPTCDLEGYFPIDYVKECLQQIVFRATSRSTGRITNEFYTIRDTDDLSDLQKEIHNLDALSVYDIQIGYQMKAPFAEQVFVETRVAETCFSVPLNPIDLKLNLFYNASYYVEWKEPPALLNSPPVCYYIVRYSYDSGTVTEIELQDTFVYLSKEESQTRLVLSVFSVNDIRCLAASYSWINNCVPNKLRSSSGSSFLIEPGTDFTLRATGNSMKFSKWIVFLPIISLFKSILN